MRCGGGPPAPRLELCLQQAAAELRQVEARDLPETPQQLVDLYASMGQVIARAEAGLLSALDALDPRTGGGAADPAGPYQAARDQAMSLLRRAGAQFDRIGQAFGPLVHGPNAWPNQPVVVAKDRGDGQPLVHYRNTYKKAELLDETGRRAEYQERVERFVSRGGDFAKLAAAQPGALARLPHGEHQDYVLRSDGSLRMASLEQRPKPGHTMLAGAGPEFYDQPVLAAGELWVYRDSAGDLEAVVLANNSGHYKPAYDDLHNALPALEKLGVPADKVILFGGPNNLPSMLEEIGEKYPEIDITRALPPDAAVLRAELNASYDPIAIRSV